MVSLETENSKLVCVGCYLAAQGICYYIREAEARQLFAAMLSISEKSNKDKINAIR